MLIIIENTQILELIKNMFIFYYFYSNANCDKPQEVSKHSQY